MLGALPGIVECAVGEVERPGESWLVAWVVSESPAPDPARWRAALQAQLPVYMVPQAFEVLDALPRRANGKLARERLPAPGARTRAAVPPRTELESILTGLWRDLLGERRRWASTTTSSPSAATR